MIEEPLTHITLLLLFELYSFIIIIIVINHVKNNIRDKDANGDEIMLIKVLITEMITVEIGEITGKYFCFLLVPGLYYS